MADVEMTDAGAAPKMKSTKAGASGDVAEGKKKFEVKKSLSGLGTSLSTTAPFAVTTSWTCASTARPTRHLRRVRSALSRGESATTPSTSTASQGGSRLAKCVRSTTVTGSGRSTVAEETKVDDGISKNYDISYWTVHTVWTA